MSSKDIHDQRRNYQLSELTEEKISPDPFRQFSEWFEDANKAEMIEPNAMVLSTATQKGKPSSRVVLLKAFSENGFVFYSNYESKKGRTLAENNQACLLFFWDKLERQIRIEGTVEKIEARLSDEYFAKRPIESRLSAIVSKQSEEIPSRQYLEEKLEQLRETGSAQRPENWGGYILKANYFEFWQGRASRLHDRIVYELQNDAWKIKRLAP
jgi:pyridoxamine 5'-phosphate oxidase